MRAWGSAGWITDTAGLITEGNARRGPLGTNWMWEKRAYQCIIFDILTLRSLCSYEVTSEWRYSAGSSEMEHQIWESSSERLKAKPWE